MSDKKKEHFLRKKKGPWLSFIVGLRGVSKLRFSRPRDLQNLYMWNP